MGYAVAAAQIGVGIAGLFGASNEADAQRARGQYQQQIYNENAAQADLQAEEAIKVGAEQGTKYMEAVRSTGSKQSSSYAAQGVDVGRGVSKDVMDETAAKGIQDVLTIKDNAWKTAWGFKQEARNLRQQGKLAAMGGNAQASSTLATGGLNFANNVIGSYKYFKDA